MLPPPSTSTLFPYTTLFRSQTDGSREGASLAFGRPGPRRSDKRIERLNGHREQLLRSEEHTSELQSRPHLVCRLLLEKKKNHTRQLMGHPPLADRDP